jgi:hypothetical protein
MISKAAQYRSYYEVAQKIKNPEARLAFYDALDAYRFDGIEPEGLPLEADIAFTAIKANIDADLGRKHAGAPAGNQNARKQSKNNSETIQNNSKQLIDLEKTNNVDVDDNDDVNEDVNTHTENEEEPEKNMCVPAYIPEIPQPNKTFAKRLAGDLYKIITEHNAQTQKERKVPVSNDIFTFSCKEMRELFSAIGTAEPGDKVKHALENFLKVCRSDTWMKSHTWSTFCKHYNDYTPEFFTLERYLNAEPQTEDASKKPENAFFFAHKDDPRFHVETFQAHIDDWKAEGRPDGADYLALQTLWETENAD